MTFFTGYKKQMLRISNTLIPLVGFQDRILLYYLKTSHNTCPDVNCRQTLLTCNAINTAKDLF